jgi:hypothetical protein
LAGWEGKAAPELELRGIKGDTVSLEQLKGKLVSHHWIGYVPSSELRSAIEAGLNEQ